MKITDEKRNDVLICNVEGDITMDTSPQLRKTFHAYIENNITKIIIDFTSVPFIDSSGLATLIELLKRLKASGGTLRMCNMSEKVKDVFEITKLHKLFAVYPTLAEAVNGF